MNKTLMLNQLQEYYKMPKDANFAAFLGIKPQTLHNWKARNTFNADLLYTKCVGINPEWLLTFKGEPFPSKITENGTVIIYNNSVHNIVMIDAKASTGMPANLQNPGFFESFPKFTLPGDRYNVGKFICLQVSGDAMYPTVKNNEWVIAQELEDLQFKNGYVHLVVTNEAIFCKRLYKKKHSDYIEVISDNSEVYPEELIHYSAIQRVYQATDKITDDFHNWNDDVHREISVLRNDIQQLRQQLFNLSSKK